MKILFLGSYNESSILTGPEKVAKRIFNKCSTEHDSVFITYFFDGRKHGLVKKLFGKEIIKVPEGKIYRMGLLRIFSHLFGFKPDIIHIITFERFAVISFFYKIFCKVKIFYTVHGVIAYEDKINPHASIWLKIKNKFCEKRFFKNSDRLIFLSERSVKTGEEYFRFDKSKIKIIPNGIDNIFHVIGREKKINLSGVLKIVFTGDINKKEKGFDFFTAGLNKIAFPAEVYAVGNSSGPADHFMSNIKIIFKEKMKTEEFSEFLSDKDIYISASSYEQFSISAVETMAAGLAAVVTAETGMSPFIKNGTNGFVIRYGNEDEMVDIINALNSDRIKLEAISHQSRKIYELLSWEKVFGKYKTLYE